MPIKWRPATLNDIEPGLSIQPKYRGDALVGVQPALEAWKHLFLDRFFNAGVFESESSLPRSQRMVGFGASVLVSSEFAEAELGGSPHGYQLPGHRKYSCRPVGIGNSSRSCASERRRRS